jgi:hypothetical protein
MTSLSRALSAWPALAGGSLPPRISYERGIWGKIASPLSSYRWIATSSAFPERLDEQLLLGSEDTPRLATYWRNLGELCLAMVTYPSPATDAAVHSGFLEKQIFAWRRGPLPATLGALTLLPRVAQTDSGIWRDRISSLTGEDPLPLDPEDHEPFEISFDELEETVENGFSAIESTIQEEALARFYAHLLAGHRAVPLAGLTAPLGPEALAVLLLPLPREVADQLSLAGWLPSQRISSLADLQRCWNAALGGDAILPGSVEPTLEHQERGRDLARSVFSRVPARTFRQPARGIQPPAERRPVQFALWGASAAGKTALIAQLFLGNLGNEATGWRVNSAPTSGKFFKDMKNLIRTGRRFPPATPLGPEPVEYRLLRSKDDFEVALRLEDWPGNASTELTEQMRLHLATADGLVLLVDPTTQGDTFYGYLLSVLERLHFDRTGKDPRPIAVCLSKIDLLIETMNDLRIATEDPDCFVRRHDQIGLARLLDHFCANYRFFPVSAAGVRVRYGLVESVVFYDNELSPRIAPGGEPINLMEPFAWLLNEVIKAS